MLSCTGGYVWDATSWDWLLLELSHVATDSTSARKWKRAAAYTLAKAAQVAVPRMMADWKYKEVSTRLVALKTSTIIKQVFYEQYICLKKAKDESKPIADHDSKRGRMGKRLRDIMRWVIVNHEFQYEVKNEAYHFLNLKLNPDFERKLQAMNTQKMSKANENNLFLSKFLLNDIPSGSFYDSFEYNYDAPRLLTLDPFPESLLTLGPSSLTDSTTNMDLSNLIEVPPCDYDEIVNDPLNILGPLKLQPAETEPKDETQLQEYKLLKSINEIFYTPIMNPPTNNTKEDKVEDIVMFDVNEELKHTIYSNEDEEFMDYFTHLPELNSSYYFKLNKY
jgi:hypothetical protein